MCSILSCRWFRRATFLSGWLLVLLAPFAQAADSVDDVRAHAERGDARAQCSLGVWYQFGLFLPKDFAQAMMWYRKAADQGNVDAQFNLGVMYNRGNGVERDVMEAYKWYSLAAGQGRREAVTERDRLSATMTKEQIQEANRRGAAFVVKRDTARATDSPPEEAREQKRATESFRQTEPSKKEKAAPKAEFEEPSPKKATGDSEVETLLASARAGKAASQRKLGDRFVKGDGVTQDYMEASRWYYQAASRGDAWAMESLGILCEKGQGVSHNDIEAYKWYELAVRSGGSWFAEGRGRVASHMTAEQINEGERRAASFKPEAGSN